ncbi:MAG: ferritin-like domain-containing protein [Actinomycetota bacterium]|nr:ferritin-like domain-containing protein [Actinomycetota bacterium]
MTELDALQLALAAEHAAAYAYGVVGARLAEPERTRALSSYAGHLARRDRLADLVRDLGATPVAAAAGYDVPELETAAAARRLAATVEDRVAATYADAVAATSGRTREMTVLGLTEAAVRAASWRGRTVAFPGLPERS